MTLDPMSPVAVIPAPLEDVTFPLPQVAVMAMKRSILLGGPSIDRATETKLRSDPLAREDLTVQTPDGSVAMRPLETWLVSLADPTAATVKCRRSSLHVFIPMGSDFGQQVQLFPDDGLSATITWTGQPAQWNDANRLVLSLCDRNDSSRAVHGLEMIVPFSNDIAGENSYHDVVRAMQDPASGIALRVSYTLGYFRVEDGRPPIPVAVSPIATEARAVQAVAAGTLKTAVLMTAEPVQLASSA